VLTALALQVTKDGRNKMFLSRQTWWALQQTTYGFIGLGVCLQPFVDACMCMTCLAVADTKICHAAVSHYGPMAPKGCGIRPSRCSQDPLEAYFNYIRSCGGGVHPTMRQCFDRARGRQMITALSSSANNGMRGKKEAKWDERCADLPLHSSRTGGSSKVDIVQKAEEDKCIASIW
jgi:hypothetical protein